MKVPSVFDTMTLGGKASRHAVQQQRMHCHRLAKGTMMVPQEPLLMHNAAFFCYYNANSILESFEYIYQISSKLICDPYNFELYHLVGAFFETPCSYYKVKRCHFSLQNCILVALLIIAAVFSDDTVLLCM